MSRRRVWKLQGDLFDAEANGLIFEVPRGATLLMAAVESHTGTEKLSIWIDVDIDAKPTNRKFRIIGTGQRVPEDAVYISTLIIGPRLVMHAFEVFS